MSSGPAETASLQITEIRRDGFNLRFSQVMRNRLHDGGVVRLGLVLTSFLFPVRQFPVDVVMELPCQTRKCVGAFGILPVTGSAWRNLSTGNAFFIDFLPRGHQFLWSSPQRFGVEVPEIRGQGLEHWRAQNMRHVKHDGVGSPTLDKRLQLILEVLR